MATYSYRAISADGRTVSGSLNAERIELASRQLRGQGLTLLEINPGGGVVSGSGGGSKSVGREQVLSLTRDLAVLLRAGLPIDRALRVMIDMAADEKMAALLNELLSAVKGGKGLSEALEPRQELFGSFYINMVRAGEASGNLGGVLDRLLAYLENAQRVRSSVVSALIYPVILLSVAVISVAVILGFVVPKFEELFADMGDALPMLTRGVIALGDFFASWGWLLLLLLLALGVAFRNWSRTPAGRASLDARLLKLPLLGTVIYKYEVAKFARTVGTLLGNGVSLLKAISIALGTVDNTPIREALSVLEPAVKRGQRMSATLDGTGEFSPLLVQMIRVGEESGSLDQMMLELAQVYDEEVQAGIKRSLTLLEPALILVLGGSIALVIIAILLGILSVNDLAL